MNASWYASNHWLVLGARIHLAAVAEPRAVHADEAAFATYDAATVDALVAHDYETAAPSRLRIGTPGFAVWGAR